MLRKSDGALKYETIRNVDSEVCDPSNGQKRRLQQIGCKDESEYHDNEVQGCKTKVKNMVADEDMKRRTFEDEGMILIGDILCPLKTR